MTIPYIENLSENIARTFRQFGIATTFKPTHTIKNKLMKMKDRVHDYDQHGAIYEIESKEDRKDDYIGESGRPLKETLYEPDEHKIMTHEESKQNYSIKSETTTTEEKRTRRGTRVRNYRDKNNGNEVIWNVGESEVATYMVEQDLRKEDMKVKIIDNEENKWKRGIKEAINIKRKKTKLNKDEGRYHLSNIYDVVLDNKFERKHSKKETAISLTEEAVPTSQRN